MIQTAILGYLDDFEVEPEDEPKRERKPREYQRRIIGEARILLEQASSVLVTMATGTGKTFVAREIVRFALEERNRRVLWIVGREELVNQAYDTLEDIGGVEKEIQDWKATTDARIVVASKDSLIHRLKKYPPDFFGMVVTDETHHGIAKTYRKIYAHFNAGSIACWHLGLTATPDRTDKLALGSDLGGLFAAYTEPYDYFRGKSDGWLVPFKILRIKLKEVDLSNVKTVAGDLQQDQLAAIMESEKPLHGAARGLLNETGDRPTIVFAASVGHAERLAEILNRYRPGCARVVTGTTNKEIRRGLFRHFGRSYQFLCNYGVATEGVDLPLARCLAMLRITKSRLLWTQMAGRGTRPYPGVDDVEGEGTARIAWIAASKKPDCLLLDFVGIAGKHKIVGPLDVLGGKEVPEELRRVAEEIMTENPSTVEEAFEEAAIRIEEQKREAEERARKQLISDQARRADIKGEATYSATEVPEEVLLREDGKMDAPDSRPDPTQITEANKLGVTLPPGCTRFQAAKLIRIERERRKAGLATAKQVDFLLRHWNGGNIFEVSHDVAKAIIGGLIARWNSKARKR